MTRNIVLIRHAKSAWDVPGATDVERPLKQRGIRDAKLMGKVFQRQQELPDLLLTSHAKRAMMTSAIFLDVLDFPEQKRKIEPLLYHATPEQIWQIITSLPDSVHSVLIFGHNPGLTQYANWFSPEGLDNIPTTGMVFLESTASTWKDFDAKNTILKEFSYPKQYIEY